MGSPQCPHLRRDWMGSPQCPHLHSDLRCDVRAGTAPFALAPHLLHALRGQRRRAYSGVLTPGCFRPPAWCTRYVISAGLTPGYAVVYSQRVASCVLHAECRWWGTLEYSHRGASVRRRGACCVPSAVRCTATCGPRALRRLLACVRRPCGRPERCMERHGEAMRRVCARRAALHHRSSRSVRSEGVGRRVCGVAPAGQEEAARRGGGQEEAQVYATKTSWPPSLHRPRCAGMPL